jgi:peptidoglycan/LPS O-acetylase OafA/YrhL
MRLGTVVVLLVLVLILAMSMYMAYSGLGDMPAAGWVAMIAGVVFSFLIGIGLMALLFYSSRRGYDEPPTLEDKSGK